MSSEWDFILDMCDSLDTAYGMKLEKEPSKRLVIFLKENNYDIIGIDYDQCLIQYTVKFKKHKYNYKNHFNNYITKITDKSIEEDLPNVDPLIQMIKLDLAIQGIDPKEATLSQIRESVVDVGAKLRESLGKK